MKNLELYVHIPFCVKKCAYCDFLSFSCDERTQRSYVEALLREIMFYAQKMKDYQVSTIFIGGGTPSWLDEDWMVEILRTIFGHFHMKSDAEVTMECNPGTLTISKLEKYRKAGVNRLSIGLQSADEGELKILGRIHTYEKFLKTYEMARNAGFTNINVDLMSGIPYQTAEKFLSTLQKVIRLKPNHISVYSLIVEEGTPFYEAYKADLEKQAAGLQTDILPSEDEVYRIIKMTQHCLAAAGYEQYEISNFALPGFACTHNIGYWTRENYLGFGLGAASLVENVRYTNTADMETYKRASMQIDTIPFKQPDGTSINGTNLHIAADVISQKAQMEEFMFLGLRMKQGVTRQQFQSDFGVPIEMIYKQVLDSLKAQGLLEMNAGAIMLTERGQDVSNYVLAQFLL